MTHQFFLVFLVWMTVHALAMPVLPAPRPGLKPALSKPVASIPKPKAPVPVSKPVSPHPVVPGVKPVSAPIVGTQSAPKSPQVPAAAPVKAGIPAAKLPAAPAPAAAKPVVNVSGNSVGKPPVPVAKPASKEPVKPAAAGTVNSVGAKPKRPAVKPAVVVAPAPAPVVPATDPCPQGKLLHYTPRRAKIGQIKNLDAIESVRCTDPDARTPPKIDASEITVSLNAGRCSGPPLPKARSHPHPFGNKERIVFPVTECNAPRVQLEEFAVFKSASDRRDFFASGNTDRSPPKAGIFRVIYTVPDVNTGDVTFCGVIAHSGTDNSFQKTPCQKATR